MLSAHDNAIDKLNCDTCGEDKHIRQILTMQEIIFLAIIRTYNLPVKSENN